MITDGKASAVWDTLLAGTRDEGENWIPRCAGVIAARSHILIFIPVAGPGANHTTLFPFSSKHPDYLDYLQSNTWPQAGKRQKVQWCLDPLPLQQHIYLLLKCPNLLIKGKRLALKLATTPPEANSSWLFLKVDQLFSLHDKLLLLILTGLERVNRCEMDLTQPILYCLWVVIKTLAALYFSFYPVYCKHYNH